MKLIRQKKNGNRGCNSGERDQTSALNKETWNNKKRNEWIFFQSQTDVCGMRRENGDGLLQGWPNASKKDGDVIDMVGERRGKTASALAPYEAASQLYLLRQAV